MLVRGRYSERVSAMDRTALATRIILEFRRWLVADRSMSCRPVVFSNGTLLCSWAFHETMFMRG